MPKPWGFTTKQRRDSMKERVIFLVTKDELNALDKHATDIYFGNRSMVIRQALEDYYPKIFKKSSK